MFYVDDLIVFYKTYIRGVKLLMQLMEDYEDISSQEISKEKSSVFFGKDITRKQALLDLMEGPEGRLPFTYLGALIFKGASKIEFFKRTVDRVCAKFASRKGCLSQWHEEYSW